MAVPSDHFGRAVAMFDFEPEEEGELALSQGDLVLVFHRDPSGWWSGECNNSYGVFPADYVQIINEGEQSQEDMPSSFAHVNFASIAEPTGDVRHAIVLVDFEPTTEEELRLKKGSIVKVVDQDPSGCWAGIVEADGRYGVFPSRCVALVEKSPNACSNQHAAPRTALHHKYIEEAKRRAREHPLPMQGVVVKPYRSGFSSEANVCIDEETGF
eukprot:CAMPEP_0177673142 /NCGR_PEP_ID=MMETSP0447-20121125/25766_1 /TAXON_ID=0 /ORGANISM="Stygamoeba regulata, Strain BSH-02190019" /LENGTH=212 /DNA_ID=CAMNT_0019180955 /DNA_START=44 /DNA_END=682 /DNA_ORIENTATION=-